MKKLKLFALGLLSSSLMLTSCADDNDDDTAIPPVLTVVENSEGIENGSVEVVVGSSVDFTWDARKGDADLNTFEVLIDGVSISETTNNGHTLPYQISGSDENTYVDGISFPINSVSSKDYTFIVEDADGLRKSVTVTVNAVAGTNPLSSAKAFTWERKGSNAGTGLAQFGLEWTNNTSNSAIIATDASTKMVLLNPSDWTSITTHADLMAAVDGGTSVAQYSGVSATKDDTYDDVLGVSKGDGTYYLIHITSGDVETDPVAGTTITIDGEYKE